jgi:cardiolipin synthase
MPDGSRVHGSRFDGPPSAGLLTVPNLITLARIGAVPLAVWLVVRHDFVLAFWLFLAAGVSDGIDGWLARRGAASAVGAVLDPVADKALMVSMYVALAAVGVLPAWLAILVVFRDLVIVGGVLCLSFIGIRVAIQPLLISKLNTVLQILLVAVALLCTGFHDPIPWMVTGLILAVAASTIASGFAYVWQWTVRP